MKRSKRINNENKILENLEELITRFEEHKKIIYDHYVQLIALVLNCKITDKNEIEIIMDGLMDYGEEERRIRDIESHKQNCTYKNTLGNEIKSLSRVSKFDTHKE